MSFHVEWERLARQAWDQIPGSDRLPVADAVMQLMHHGIPDAAVPGEDGRWTLAAGKYVLLITENELDIYLCEIEKA